MTLLNLRMFDDILTSEFHPVALFTGNGICSHRDLNNSYLLGAHLAEAYINTTWLVNTSHRSARCFAQGALSVRHQNVTLYTEKSRSTMKLPALRSRPKLAASRARKIYIKELPRPTNRRVAAMSHRLIHPKLPKVDLALLFEGSQAKQKDETHPLCLRAFLTPPSCNQEEWAQWLKPTLDD